MKTKTQNIDQQTPIISVSTSTHEMKHQSEQCQLTLLNYNSNEQKKLLAKHNQQLNKLWQQRERLYQSMKIYSAHHSKRYIKRNKQVRKSRVVDIKQFDENIIVIPSLPYRDPSHQTQGISHYKKAQLHKEIREFLNIKDETKQQRLEGLTLMQYIHKHLGNTQNKQHQSQSKENVEMCIHNKQTTNQSSQQSITSLMELLTDTCKTEITMRNSKHQNLQVKSNMKSIVRMFQRGDSVNFQDLLVQIQMQITDSNKVVTKMIQYNLIRLLWPHQLIDYYFNKII